MPNRLLFAALTLAAFLPLALRAAEKSDLGDFESQADVGTVQPAGAASFDPATKTYTLKSSGANIWNKHDDFHFLYRKLTGDLTLSADISLVGEGKNAHRKAGLMIRESLEPDAPYADVMLHGDGLIALQYRPAKGEATLDIKSEIKAPAMIRLQRTGDTITAYAAPAMKQTDKPRTDADFKLIGTVKLTFKSPLLGLALTAHDPATTETATFNNVTVSSK